ncbi:MAG: ArnT family glycosyltransferase [Terriglobales bacterium]
MTTFAHAEPRLVLVERPSTASRRWLYPLLIVCLWAAIYIPGLFHPPLLDDADSVHAEAAREMALSGDWVTLHANGVRYLEKAPLMYWMMAASFKLFGVAEWPARLPLALATLATLFAAFALAKHIYSARAGLYAAVIVATGFGPYVFTRILIPDLLVGLWITLGLLFFLRTLEQRQPSRPYCWGLAVTAALNVLTKGLIGLVFPVIIIVTFLLLTGNLRHLLRMRLLSSTLVFLTVAAPWHILAGLRNPGVPGVVHGFFWFYFVNEHFLRYLNKRVPMDYGTVPLVVFWGLLLVWAFPWAAFVIQAIAQVPHRIREFTTTVKNNLTQRATLLLAIWVVVIVGFFSFSTRQEYYTIPAAPGLALLLAGVLAREHASPDLRRWGRWSSAFLLVIGTAAFGAAMFFLHFAQAPPPGYDLADLLKRNPENTYALAFGHIFDLTPQALGAFRAPLAGFGIALLAGTALNLWLRRRGRIAAANTALTFMMMAVLFCVHLGMIEFSPILTSKPLALEVKRVLKPGDIIVINAEYEPGSTMNFYTGQQVHVVRKFGNLWYGSFWPDTPEIYEDEASLARRWANPGRVFLWTNAEHSKLPEGLPAYEFARYGGKHIYTNQPVAR